MGTDDAINRDVERAVSNWEESVRWIVQGWDCLEEYQDDLSYRESLDELILFLQKKKLPSAIESRVQQADRKFRDVTLETNLCVWHVSAQYRIEGNHVTLTFTEYDQERYWYYYRWPSDAPYLQGGHDSISYQRKCYGMDFETMSEEELKSVALQNAQRWRASN